ncbi:hypothetical protein DX932_30860 [Bacillus cereus]|uniref:Integrase catalytic domain-containing protein n=1 Tax=Bacillus cereus TaxID=1396 RepID=A0A9W7PZ10_BACCE|nr:hypothetical protein DX932_30860 [Bacillus cereus]
MKYPFLNRTCHFHGFLKKELIYQQQYVTRAQAQQDIWGYIEIKSFSE